MIKESNYCSNVIKKHFNKELVISKKDDFKNSSKCWNCDNIYVYDDVKVTDHCHITKYRSSVHRYC